MRYKGQGAAEEGPGAKGCKGPMFQALKRLNNMNLTENVWKWVKWKQYMVSITQYVKFECIIYHI